MTARWWILIRALGYKIRYIVLIGYRLVGNAVSYFTPGPQFGGEPIQIFLLHRIQKIPTDASTASIAFDRLMELIANFTFLIIGTICFIRLEVFKDFPASEILFIAVVLLGLPITILGMIRIGIRPFSFLLGSLGKFYSIRTIMESNAYGKIAHTIYSSELLAESICQKHPVVIFQSMGFSILNWGCIFFEFGLMLHFLGLELKITELIILITAARIAFLTPLPGGLGVLEAGQVLILKSLGFNPSFGLSLCVIMRARDLIFGSIGLWLMSVYLFSANRQSIQSSDFRPR